MNDRFKFRVWDKYMKGYVKENLGEKYVWIEDDGQLGAGTDDDSCVLEQCTGLKDKNGKLIYENDIVLGDTGFKYCIIWSEMELGWALQNLETKLCIAMNAFTLDEIEIIGNIHEQAEQKE